MTVETNRTNVTFASGSLPKSTRTFYSTPQSLFMYTRGRRNQRGCMSSAQEGEARLSSSLSQIGQTIMTSIVTSVESKDPTYNIWIHICRSCPPLWVWTGTASGQTPRLDVPASMTHLYSMMTKRVCVSDNNRSLAALQRVCKCKLTSLESVFYVSPNK